MATNCRECGSDLPAPGVEESGVEEPAPALPVPKLIDPLDLEALIDFADGFHRPDWAKVWQWIEQAIDPEERQDARDEAALFWVSQLRKDLGGNYSIWLSKHTVLLCEQSPDIARWLLDYTERTATTIEQRLGNLAWRDAPARRVVLVFSDQDDFYQYVAFHLLEGEHPAVGAVCIHSGYTHVAIPWTDYLDVANSIAHELVHDCLAHLPLPIWLNEGVAVVLQKLIAPPRRYIGQGEQQALSSGAINWRAPVMWAELAERHFAFWNEAHMQSFWAGTSFHEPGDANELSYSLAEVLVTLLNEQGKDMVFRAFLAAAHRNDAGQTAALDILDVDLGVAAGTFLGPGNWRPLRKKLVEQWKAAGWSSDNVPRKEEL
jgi:hypothetical protein